MRKTPFGFLLCEEKINQNLEITLQVALLYKVKKYEPRRDDSDPCGMSVQKVHYTVPFVVEIRLYQDKWGNWFTQYNKSSQHGNYKRTRKNSIWGWTPSSGLITDKEQKKYCEETQLALLNLA